MNNKTTVGTMYQPTFYTNVGFANLNGLKRQLAELGDFMTDENIDIMLINETHLRPCDKARLPNYKLVRKDRLLNRGGGTAIYSKTEVAQEHWPTFYQYRPTL